MPEGHSIHRLARDLRELLGVPVAATSPQGKFAAGAAELGGGTPAAAEAHGKHLLIRFDGRPALHVHLGMQGKLLRFPAPAGPAPRQVRLRLHGPPAAWDLIAPSACELLDEAGTAALLARLGPDPLRPDADRELALANLATAPIPIGIALVDQRLVAGVGNVFRAEALRAAGIHPGRLAADLEPGELDRLWDVLVPMMRRAVDDNRIVTVDPPGGAPRTSIPEAEARHVYKQDTCRTCATPVDIWPLGGRTAYACPTCQPAA